MKETNANIAVDAVFSEDGKHRYALTYTWNKELPRLSILMIIPGSSPKVDSEHTSMGLTEYLCLSNCSKLQHYGAITIINLFSRISDDYAQIPKNSFKGATNEENDEVIMETIKDTDIIIAPGSTVCTSKIPYLRACQVFKELEEKYPDRLYYIGDGYRHGNHHPLDVYMRHSWVLEKAIKPYEQLLKNSKFEKTDKKNLKSPKDTSAQKNKNNN